MCMTHTYKGPLAVLHVNPTTTLYGIKCTSYVRLDHFCSCSLLVLDAVFSFKGESNIYGFSLLQVTFILVLYMLTMVWNDQRARHEQQNLFKSWIWPLQLSSCFQVRWMKTFIEFASINFIQFLQLLSEAMCVCVLCVCDDPDQSLSLYRWVFCWTSLQSNLCHVPPSSLLLDFFFPLLFPSFPCPLLNQVQKLWADTSAFCWFLPVSALSVLQFFPFLLFLQWRISWKGLD